MTCDADARQDHEHLFLADFYPELGDYLAGQCAAAYDARTGRVRFRAWLIAHAEKTAIAEAEEATAEHEAVELQVAAEEILVLSLGFNLNSIHIRIYVDYSLIYLIGA
jgi:hypothetical protein